MVTPAMPNAVLATARSYVGAGLSVSPIRPDGTKIAAVAWGAYQRIRATDQELISWFGRSSNGIAIIAGAVSGNLVVMDFDAPGAWPEFLQAIEDHGMESLVAALPLVKTPRDGDGHHLYIRVEGMPVGESRKLAMLAAPYVDSHGKEHRVKIETRGEGGYVVAPGSPDACHEDNRPYTLVRGDLTEIPTISTEQYTALLRIAAMLDESPPVKVQGQAPPTKALAPGEVRPGDDYSQRGDIEALLTSYGWYLVRTTPTGEQYWRRPGKTGRAWSATFNYKGSRAFKVFSSSAAPFEPDKAYAPFGVYALLEHAGNFREAAAALRRGGYGSEPKQLQRGHAAAQVVEIEMQCDPATPSVLRFPFRDESYFDNLPPVEWLIEGILPKACFAVLYGEPEAGKTFVALDWSFSISEGRPWMSHGTSKGPVGYIVAESARGIRSRKNAWKQHHSVDSLSNWRGVIGAPNLASVEDTLAIMDSLKALPEMPLMLVVDTLSKCFVGNENATEDMQKFTRHCLHFVMETGCTVVALHHMDKQGEKERGSSTLRGDADVLIPLRKQSADRIVLGGKGTKQKESEAFPELHMKFLQVAGSRVLAPVAVRRKLTKNEERVVAIVTTDGPSSQAEIRGATGLPKASVADAVRQLLADRWLADDAGTYSLHPDRWGEA
jgi:hypothetical protein